VTSSINGPDIRITDLINSTEFTRSAEIVPPRNGVSMQVIFDQIQALVTAGAEFLAVTKGAGGALRGGSLPIAQMIKERFQVPCIAHFTCRDLLPEEVESSLVDHHFFGIRNILALRGDPPVGVTDWTTREGSHNFAHQLISQIGALNEGRYLERPGFKVQEREPTDFCIGAACYPDEPDFEKRVGHLKQKVEAGAEYAITQMMFDADSYARYLDECAAQGVKIPVLPGVRIARSRPQAERIAKRFGIPASEALLAKLPTDDKVLSNDQALAAFMDLTEQFRRAGAPGIHLFVLSDTELACALLKELAAHPKHVAAV
jgi:methylenetetrahydrofolate reductase (NADPH)